MGRKQQRDSDEDSDDESIDDSSGSEESPQKKSKTETCQDETGFRQPKLPARDDARGTIEYLVLTLCRPLGLANLIDHTNGRFDKGVISAMLDLLERKKTIKSKQLGTSKIWWSAHCGSASVNEVASLQGELNSAKSDAESLEAEINRVARHEKSLRNEPVDIDSALAAEKELVKSLEDRVHFLRSPQGVSPADVAAAGSLFNKTRSAWLLRKRGYRDCLDTLADAMERKPKDILRDIADYAAYDISPADDNVPPPIKISRK